MAENTIATWSLPEASTATSAVIPCGGGGGGGGALRRRQERHLRWRARAGNHPPGRGPTSAAPSWIPNPRPRCFRELKHYLAACGRYLFSTRGVLAWHQYRDRCRCQPEVSVHRYVLDNHERGAQAWIPQVSVGPRPTVACRGGLRFSTVEAAEDGRLRTLAV